MSPIDSDQAALLRVDKLIAKGSLAAARAELQKLAAVVSDPKLKADAEQRLGRCELELRRQRSREWVKRGRKSEKRGKIAEALEAFGQAQRLAEEPWMAQRISDLQAALGKQALAARARTAETAGDWQAATRLYAEAGADDARRLVRLRQARDQLESGDHAAAAESYASAAGLSSLGRGSDALRAAPLSERDLYDWGYCCYRQGWLLDCLRTWDRLACSSPELMQQREAVQNLLHEQVLADFCGGGEPSPELEAPAAYLHQARPTEETQDILDFYFLRRIERHWRGEQLLTLLHVLDEEAALVSSKIHEHPRLVEVYAKTGFKLAEASAEHLPLFNLYYLTAVHQRRFSRGKGEEKIRPDRIREVLVELGDEMVQRYRDSSDGAVQRELRLWRLEKEIMTELASILPRNRVAVSEAICTPQFAWRFGRGRAVLALLEQNRHRAGDLRSFLALGAYFTPHGPSLYAVELGEVPAESPSASEPQDEFERFAWNKLCYLEGLRMIGAKRQPPRRFLRAALEHFFVDGEGEAIFLALASKEDDPERVDQYIELLKQLCRGRPHGEASKVLSRLMSRRAGDQFGEGEISVKVFRNILHQALEWDPANEGARGALKDARREHELEDLGKAFQRFKYERFCQIAAGSEFEEVHDASFRLLVGAAATVHRLDADVRPIALWELKRCVLNLDPSHPLLSEIERMLQSQDRS